MDNLNNTKLNIQESENALPSLISKIENLENAVIILDRHHNCLFLNNAAEQLLIHETEALSVTSLLQSLDCDLVNDKLTGLPTQNLLLQQIKQAINLAQESTNYIFAVLFLDINRFKIINSSLGRTLGDQLLIAIAKRLQTCLRSEDLIARVGSDEFAILLEDIENISYATNIAERIYKEFILPFELDSCEIFVEASIGIALGDRSYMRAEDLLRDAELAVSNAKRTHRDRYQIFNQTMHAHAMTLLQLENDLRWAIKRKEFELHYQPIVSLAHKTIAGFEVLVRWQHPTRGLVLPSEFIYLAEETGLIVPLGLWVLREACSQMKAWQLQFFNKISHWKISVNISSKQLAQVNFVQQVQNILQDTEFNPHNLKLEITESCLIEDSEATLATLKNLKGLGIEFSLDDFGTGYSSLSYLHQFPFNTLKIDRSFVNSIDTNNEKLGIIRAIITLARNLNMDTIAEGIETVNQIAQLKALKCQYGQGYLLSKPLNQQATESLIIRELEKRDYLSSDNYQSILEEQIAQEQLIFHLEKLSQELEELKQEKADLEIMLETTAEHADCVEAQLHNEIIERRKAESALNQANQELEKLTILDSLTQVANRRRFDDYLLQEWIKLRQQKAPIGLILCDIDYFKLYNDTYGHPIGDYCLKQVALAIESMIQANSGLVARYGGEEFAIILPYADGKQALEVAEAIRLRVHSLKIVHQKSLVNEYVTMSLGVFSIVPNPESSPELLVAFADKALYEAKAKGRNIANLFFS
jgi:diguanylate cyclase (GGDEF)-like protein